MTPEKRVRSLDNLSWVGRILMSWALVIVSIGFSAGLFARF